MHNISIGRWSDGNGNSGIDIKIEDSKFCVVFRGRMTLEDFAKCVTGQAFIPIEKKYPKDDSTKGDGEK